MVKNSKMGFDMSKLNIQIKNKNLLVVCILISVFILLLLFKRKININIYVEKLLVFLIIFLLFLIITKNILYSFIGSLLLFLVINLMINNKKYVENFENENENENDETKDDEDKDKDKENFEDKKSPIDIVNELEKIMTPDAQKASNNIKDLLKKVNGGIKLSDDDTKESNPLGVDASFYSNDKKPNALREAQKETYELIDTVNTLKDTLQTLSPVLSEGKKLMSMFESIKL